MISQSTLVERFRDGAASGSASNMFIEGPAIFSYGHHFPLALKGEWGLGLKYLVNGDRYSSSTSQHTHLCIRALTPNVQIPFSALRAAALTNGNHLPSSALRIVSNRPDQWFNVCKGCQKEVVDKDGFYFHQDGSQLCGDDKMEVFHRHILGAVVLTDGARSFLSSIDEQEGWRQAAYFLCQLPKTVSSVEEAFDSLQPLEVRGKPFRRQGDILCVPVDLKTRQIQAPTEKYVRLFDSSHVVTEARRVNGTVYVRGCVRHDPRGRRAQHRILKLGNTWWVAYKNLALASWNAVGNVD